VYGLQPPARIPSRSVEVVWPARGVPVPLSSRSAGMSGRCARVRRTARPRPRGARVGPGGLV